MKTILAAFLALTTLANVSVSAQSSVGRIRLDSLTWKGNPKGVQIANIEGDPMTADKPYSVALRLASGTWIQPHWHPREQHVTVMEGELLLGKGEQLDSLGAEHLPAGAVGIVPAEARHYEGARGTTTIILYGIGPMTTTFVNPPKR